MKGTSTMVFKLFILWIGLLTAIVSASTCKSDPEEKQRHGKSSFKELHEAVNGDSLTSGDMDRLFSKLHFLNCNETKPRPDYRKCFTPTDLYNFSGTLPSKPLNSTEFTTISPAIVYCLLPAPERNDGRQHCVVSPKNHSELYNLFARKFSQHSEKSITHESLEGILEAINKTIGEYLSGKKCFSAKNIIKEIEGDHHKKEHDEHDHEEANEILDQDDFQKACASIILHLVQGFCIEEGHGHNETKSSLPSKEFFTKDLFKGKERLSEKDLAAIVERLGIVKISETSTSSPSAGDRHGGHDHSRRRRSAGSFSLPQLGSETSHIVHRRALDAHGHQTVANDTGGSCISLDDMLTIFDIDHSVGANVCSFKELCPAFIQQAMGGACKAKHQAKNADVGVHVHISKIWGYGFVSVTIISLTSLVGVATIPFIGKSMYKKILALLVALAVGSLAGDSLLHLLPHAFGLHAHEEDGDNHSGEANGFVWKSLVLMGSVYAFFVFESLMHLTLKGKVGDEKGHSHIDVEQPGHSSGHMNFKDSRNCSKFEHHEGSNPIGRSNVGEDSQWETGSVVLTNMNSKDEHGEDNVGVPPQEKTEEQKTSTWSLRSLFSGKKEKNGNALKQISAVAWMIIIGDTLHNISDGLAIGAAFAEGGKSGISGGISTSIAVFCHELPHELGDFAVLLSAGMSVKMALITNLLSAMSCYIGLAIGIYVGQQADVRLWIFAIAAGMFLYVALVDMLPDLMHCEALQTEPAVTFLCQNIGLLLGISIMLVIALYEEQLMAITF